MGQFDTRHESIIIAKHLFSIRFWSIRFPVRFEKTTIFGTSQVNNICGNKLVLIKGKSKGGCLAIYKQLPNKVIYLVLHFAS